MRKTVTGILKATMAGMVIVLAFFGAQDKGQAMGPSLRVLDASESEVEGTYTVILFGARYGDDIQTIAFLDKEGDPYTFDIYAPDFDYSVLKSVPAKEALEEAKRFVNWHPDYLRTVIGRILDEKGAVIGFEVRPLYRTIRFGTSDVMDVMYFQRGTTIRIHVKLKPQVEKQLTSGDNSTGKGGNDK